MTTYRVTGRSNYRGHAPGDTFEEELDPRAEERAVRRGSIEVVQEGDATQAQQPAGETPEPGKE